MRSGLSGAQNSFFSYSGSEHPICESPSSGFILACPFRVRAVRPLACPAFPVLCPIGGPAQSAALDEGSDFLDDDMGKNYIDCLADEIAASSQAWDPIDLLADEDALDVAQVRAATRTRAAHSLNTTGRSAAAIVYQQGGANGLHLFVASKHVVGPGYEIERREPWGGRHPGGDEGSPIAPKLGPPF